MEHPGKARKTLSREMELLGRGYDFVIGADEAGRGPLAGPVVAAAAAVVGGNAANIGILLENVDDSKKISAAKREQVYEMMAAHKDIVYSWSAVAPKDIDRINILEAAKLAMARAVAELREKLGGSGGKNIFCLIDGNFSIDTALPQESVVAGDAKIFSIAAASIVAKVTRDRIMLGYHSEYPKYGFDRHKGYGTAAHLAAIKKYGPCPIHRFSFAPLKNTVTAENERGN